MTATLTKEPPKKVANAKRMMSIEICLVDVCGKAKGTTEVYEDGNVRLIVKYE